MSKSRSMMLVRTRPPPLCKCEPPRFQQRSPSALTPLPLHKLHGGGQGRRGDGHTGSCAQTRGEVGEGASRARHGKGETQSESSDTKVLLPKLALQWVHLVNGPALVLVQRSEETRQYRGKTSQLWTLPHVATLNVAIRIELIWFSGWGSLPCHQLSPRWGFESHHTCQSSDTFDHFPQARCRRIPFKLKDQFSCHGWVSLPDHREAIRPAGPESSTPHPCG